MKIIFSRKGFDSSAGGYASPIFPNKQMWSIPIPDKYNKLRYRDLRFAYNDEHITNILNDLTKNRLVTAGKIATCDYQGENSSCHHDPQLMQGQNFDGIVLGQADAADGHLRNQFVEDGDIFLFYGWYKNIAKNNGRWEYLNNSPDIHVIWSYMIIGDIIRIDTKEERKSAIKKYPFLIEHPHLEDKFCESIKTNNSLYFSKEHKYFEYTDSRCLTDINSHKRSTWRLPSFFNQPNAFTYLKEKNFTLDGDDVIISYSGYGQEFVLDLDEISDELAKENIKEYIHKIINE